MESPVFLAGTVLGVYHRKAHSHKYIESIDQNVMEPVAVKM